MIERLGFLIKRAMLFGVWGLLGVVFSYGLLYIFAPFPYGLVVPGACALVGVGIWRLSGRRSLEMLGLLIGPALFCFWVALGADAGDSAPLAEAGAAFFAAAALIYLLIGWFRCSRARRISP